MPGDDLRKRRFTALSGRFAELFGRPAARAARAPGRVNLIGEHTDYNGGLVLPCAIDRDTRVVAAARDDGVIRIHSESEREEASFRVEEVCGVAAGRFDHWADYVRGVVFALAERGAPPGGFDLLVESDVPIGAGLSSSAAFTVALATVLAPEASARERAAVAHRAESHYLGIGSGILDQFASALGARDCALRIDCSSGEVEPISMPPDQVCLLLMDSGVRRSLAEADSGYRQRVAECGQALAEAKRGGLVPAEATSLRALEGSDPARLAAALEPLSLRRVRHVLGENRRVQECCAALEQGDLAGVGAILRDGHASLRDDYEVSIPELDALCEIADALPGVYGSRLVGAGFGGCTLHLVAPDAAEAVARDIGGAFESRFERLAPVTRVRTTAGAEPVPL